MIGFQCSNCGAHFAAHEADTGSAMADHPSYGHVEVRVRSCPECGGLRLVEAEVCCDCGRAPPESGCEDCRACSDALLVRAVTVASAVQRVH